MICNICDIPYDWMVVKRQRRRNRTKVEGGNRGANMSWGVCDKRVRVCGLVEEEMLATASILVRFHACTFRTRDEG